MKNLNVILKTACIMILPISFLTGCKSNEESEQKTKNEKDSSFEQYYKQFDSTITIQKLDSFKTKWDSLNRWRDSKRKRTVF
jgi:hypothetical protein